MAQDPFSRRQNSVRTARERLAPRAVNRDDGGRTLYGVALAAAVFFLVLSLSVRQATSEPNARRLLEAGVATLTDVDKVVAERREDLRRLASDTNQDSYPIPGYPLDVRLTRAEALQGTNVEIRDAVLSRSSAILYQRGLSAFDRTGDQSLSAFSSEGLTKYLVGQLSATTHDRATKALLVFTGLTALAAIAVVLKNEGFARVRALGISVAGGALPGAALVFAFQALVGQVWSGDPFSDDLNTIISRLLDVPLRNYLVVGGLGIALTALGLGMAALDRRFGFDPEVEGYDYERGSEEADEPSNIAPVVPGARP